MIKSISREPFFSDTVNVKYEVPSNFVLTKPSYFKASKEIQKNQTRNAFPVVVYVLCKNEKGELFKSSHASECIFYWLVRETGLPNHYLKKDSKEHLHYFLQNIDEKSHRFNKENAAYIEDAKNSGFSTIVYSVGLWVDQGIYQEQFVEYSDNYLEEISLKYAEILYQAETMYNNSPELIKYDMEKIFANSKGLAISDNYSVVAAQKLIDLLFTSNGDNAVFEKDLYFKKISVLFSEVLNLLMTLNQRSKFLRSRFKLSSESLTINLSFIGFLSYLNNREIKDLDAMVEDINGIIYKVGDIAEDMEITATHEMTEEMKELSKRYMIGLNSSLLLKA
jgi:hypothetical protein